MIVALSATMHKLPVMPCLYGLYDAAEIQLYWIFYVVYFSVLIVQLLYLFTGVLHMFNNNNTINNNIVQL